MKASLRTWVLALGLAAAPLAPGAAATVTVACAAVGIEYELCREGAEAWAARTGNAVELIQTPSLANERLALFQQLLAAGSADIDVFQIDVIWPGILAPHLVDLRPYFDDETLATYFPFMIANNTVNGELKAIPWYADVGLLYYRKDLLAKYGLSVPETWDELARAARTVVERERSAGHGRMTGFVFQAKAYEGLTCNALEWIHSHGGGRIVDADGRVTLDNPQAAAALAEAASWVGDIAPRGVLNYAEEEARGVFQSGNAVFMRNWPYAWALANGEDSPVQGKVGIAVLPHGPGGGSAGALGGGGLAVSRYSRHPRLAAELVRHLTSRQEQVRRAVDAGLNPTIPAAYEDPALIEAQPVMARIRAVLETAVARPAGTVSFRYSRLSYIFWNAVHDTLAGRGGATANLRSAADRIRRLLHRGG